MEQNTSASGTIISYLGNIADQDIDANIQNAFVGLDASKRQSVFAAIEAVKEGRNASAAFGGLNFLVRRNRSDENLITAGNIDSERNFCVGGNNLTTVATDGFLYIPMVSGVPTGVPTAKQGYRAVCWDEIDDFLYVYTDAGWKRASFIV